MTTTDGSPSDGEVYVRGEIAKMKEHIRRLEDRNNKEGCGNIGIEEVRKTRDQTCESFARSDHQGPRNKCSTKIRRTSSLEVDSKVVLKTSTYPNKRIVAYATIRSMDPATKEGGIELGAEFALVRIDESIMDNDELVREVSDCKTIGDAFIEGLCIALPSAFIRKKDN
uniref:Uncharacterized protein n=1 Tax=Avena sativa TaxID=4498 RepID=A0ACD5ZF33_AVESA